LSRALRGGTNVKPDTRREVVAAIADVVFHDDLLTTWGLVEGQTKDFRLGLTSDIEAALVAWDKSVGALRSQGPEVPSVAFAALPWIRLVSIEAALRSAAYGVTHGWAPMSESAAGALIAGRLFDHLIGLYRDLAGGISRGDIAAGGGISESTVDEWLAGRSLPQSESILNLAALFASRVPGLEEPQAELHLRIAVAASELVRWLWESCPPPTRGGEFGPPRAASFVIEFTTAATAFHTFIEGVVAQEGDHGPALWALILGGSRTPHGKALLGALLDLARDSYLRADVEGVLHERWAERVLLLYRQIPQPKNRKREAALLAKMGLPEPPTDLFPVFEEISAWGSMAPNPMGWHIPTFPPVGGLDEDSGEVAVLTFSSESFPDRPDIIAKHAMEAQHLHDDPAAALAHHRRLVQQNPESEMYRFWLGCSLAAVGMINEAIVECRIACSIKPDWSLPATEVAIILSNAERQDEALESIKLTAEQYEIDGHMAHAYGYILLQLDRQADAIPWFRRVLDENEAHPRALEYLAHCLLITGERREGRKYAKLAFHAGQRHVLEALKAGRYERG